jgi:hypothetical protein
VSPWAISERDTIPSSRPWPSITGAPLISFSVRKAASSRGHLRAHGQDLRVHHVRSGQFLHRFLSAAWSRCARVVRVHSSRSNPRATGHWRCAALKYAIRRGSCGATMGHSCASCARAADARGGVRAPVHRIHGLRADRHRCSVCPRCLDERAMIRSSTAVAFRLRLTRSSR